MLGKIDLNCDMGEGFATDALIMPLISSANIACGYHAGGGELMHQTIRLAMQHQVAIGAHPSFNDRDGFGRREMQLSGEEIHEGQQHPESNGSRGRKTIPCQATRCTLQHGGKRSNGSRCHIKGDKRN